MLLWNSTALERTSALEQVFERQHITPKEWKHLLNWTATQAEALHRASHVVTSLRNEGMVLHELGFDFTRLQAQLRTSVLSDGRARQLARETLLRGVNARDWSGQRLAHVMWECDQAARWSAACSIKKQVADHRSRRHSEGSSEWLLQKLSRDGYARITSWNLDLAELRRQAMDALMMRPRARTIASVTSHAWLPALRPLLEDTRVADAVRQYFGGPVRYEGHTVLKLLPNATRETYPSSRWHHDGCGRRLKLFIFLHDVNEATRPTVIARGTHNIHHFGHYGPSALPLSDAWVRERHSTVELTGKAGGGFIFDTNSLHRGSGALGDDVRTAIILEFHAVDKISRFLDGYLWARTPCPSVRYNATLVSLDGYPAEYPHSWRTGVGGLTLYETSKIHPPSRPRRTGDAARKPQKVVGV